MANEVWKAGRTRNLSEKQVKQGQRVIGGGRTERLKKGEGAAAMNEVKIGDTKWMSKGERGGKGRGGLLVDASGKAVTGTVTLASGAKASYVRGKRVMTAPKTAAPSRMGRGGGGGGGGGGNRGGGSTRVTPSQRGEGGGGNSGSTTRVSPSQRNEGIGGGRTTRVSPGTRGEGLNRTSRSLRYNAAEGPKRTSPNNRVGNGWASNILPGGIDPGSRTWSPQGKNLRPNYIDAYEPRQRRHVNPKKK